MILALEIGVRGFTEREVPAAECFSSVSLDKLLFRHQVVQGPLLTDSVEKVGLPKTHEY